MRCKTAPGGPFLQIVEGGFYVALILDEEVLLHPQDTTRTIWLSFSLKEPAEMLQIHFSYGPKTVTDRDLCRQLLVQGGEKYQVPDLPQGEELLEQFLPLTNLVTMGLRGPDGFVGCAHRPAPDQLHQITAEQASPGFLPCGVKAGEWRIALQVHGVFTPQCRCRVQVETMERGRTS